MTHLTSDELIDAMEEGVLSADRRRHLDACLECQRQLADLTGALNEAKQTSIPDPSPLFWQRLSTNVNAEIDKQIANAWPQWLRWQVLLPLGVTAMIILAVMLSVPKNESPVAVDETVPVAQAPESDNWGTVAELVGEIDLDAASETGIIAPGLADQAVLELTADERIELTRLLKAEMSQTKS